MRPVLSVGLVLIILAVPFSSVKAAQIEDGRFPLKSQERVRESLVGRLLAGGFEPGFVRSIFYDKRWELSLLVLRKNLVYRESKANYAHFLNTYSTALARDFLEENRAFLEKTEKDYGVEKEVIVAILLVESSFGRHVEKYRVVNTLSTLSQADHPEVLRLAVNHLSRLYPDLTPDYLRHRARSKSRWAFAELKAL
ncbi:MAG: lytic murein transglycosylase, partial [Deltaproteobacteria bacterium]|nr:lytic murein transglycosylase [Deltaproteobacteria bacterium]